MDVDSIDIGVDFAEAIQRALDVCDVLLALIGPQWLTMTDTDGQRRLDDPDDTVRLEVEAALARNIRVIPVLVDNARMPRRHELPESLMPLARRNALELTHNRYTYDLGRLLEAVETVLGLSNADGPQLSTSAEQENQTPTTPPPQAQSESETLVAAKTDKSAHIGDLDDIRRIAGAAHEATKAMPEDSEKVWTLDDLVALFMEIKDAERAADVARYTFVTARMINDDDDFDDYDSNDALGYAAKVLAWTNQFEEARNAVDATSDEHAQARARHQMAEGLTLAGDLRRAIDIVDGISSSDDFMKDAFELTKVEALADMAEILADSQRTREALRVAQKATTIAGQIDGSFRAFASVSVAKAAANAGDPEQALAIANAIKDDDHSKSRGLLEATGGFIRVGNWGKAYAVAQTIPNDFYRGLALNVVAKVFLEAGELGTATDIARQILEAFSITAGKTKPIVSTAAKILVRAGELDRVFVIANDSSTGENDKAVLLRAAAEELARAGNGAQALAIANGLINDEQKAAAMVSVTAGLVQAGDLDRALAVANAIANKPEKVNALTTVAKGLAESQQSDRASRVSSQALATAGEISSHKQRAEALVAVARMLASLR
jgi:hypothetical protein